jgi:hypothetical protein
VNEWDGAVKPKRHGRAGLKQPNKAMEYSVSVHQTELSICITQEMTLKQSWTSRLLERSTSMTPVFVEDGKWRDEGVRLSLEVQATRAGVPKCVNDVCACIETLDSTRLDSTRLDSTRLDST